MQVTNHLRRWVDEDSTAFEICVVSKKYPGLQTGKCTSDSNFLELYEDIEYAYFKNNSRWDWTEDNTDTYQYLIPLILLENEDG